MKWRPLLGLLIGLLLTMPLAWTVSRLLPGRSELTEGRDEEGKLVPRLSPEQLSQFPTYLRPCQGHEECDAPLICLRGALMVKPFCTASQCVTDRDCAAGFTCRSQREGEHVVRICGATGKATQGQWCLKLPYRQEVGCEPGLVCANHRCGRPCQPGQPQSCPEGFFCGAEDDVEGPACQPTCEGQPCPEGQRCVRVEHGASVCARVHGTDCQRDPCPAEQVCDVSTPSSDRPGEVWMRCAHACDPQGPPCPDGFECMAGRCRQRCEPGGPGTCGPDEKCTAVPRRESGVCTFDFEK